jgi:hypothetical protein
MNGSGGWGLALVLIALAIAAEGSHVEPSAHAAAHASAQIRYVANSGMLVVAAGRRFLIDAPIRDGIPPYATSTAAERTLLENARAPYDAVDAIVITHWQQAVRQ